MLNQPNCGVLFVVSAPSGGGKTSLVCALIERLASFNIKRVITYTTKQPRPQEVHGIDYHFISTQEFIQKIDQGFFLEWSSDYGSYYGTPKSILEDMAHGQSYIAIVDRKGACSLKECVSQCVLIWITPPDFDKLRDRLTARAQDTSDVIEFRLELARKELDSDNQNLFDYVLVNDDFIETLGAFEQIVLENFKANEKNP